MYYEISSEHRAHAASTAVCSLGVISDGPSGSGQGGCAAAACCLKWRPPAARCRAPPPPPRPFVLAPPPPPTYAPLLLF